MDTTTRIPADAYVPTFEPAAATTALPGVYGVTRPDGGVEYVYADSVEAALAKATPTPAATVQAITPAAAPAPPAARPALIEPWMVRSAAGLGLAAGVVALAGPAEAAAAELSASVGHLLHMAMQLGGAALVVFVLLRLLAGRKTGGRGTVEVVQTVTQTITNVVRIGE